MGKDHIVGKYMYTNEAHLLYTLPTSSTYCPPPLTTLSCFDKVTDFHFHLHLILLSYHLNKCDLAVKKDKQVQPVVNAFLLLCTKNDATDGVISKRNLVKRLIIYSTLFMMHSYK